MRRAPGQVAGALAALALATLAACGPTGGVTQAVRASAGSAAAATSTSTSTMAAATTSTTAPGRTATTTTRRATTTTKPGATTTAAPAAGAKGLAPPAAGTYRYDTSGSTTFSLAAAQSFPAVTTLVVDRAVGTTQHSTRDLRDASGNGPSTELTLDYRADGVYLVALRVTYGVSGTSDGQDFQPPAPLLLLGTGARPGAHSEADLPGGGGAKLVVDVLRTEQVTVAGKAVDTVVLQAAISLPPGDITGRLQLTVDIDPVSRLWVKEQGVTDASALGGLVQLHSQYTATLQRLTP